MLELYKNRLQAQGGSTSNAMIQNSNSIMNQTFRNSTAYKLAVINGEEVDVRFYEGSSVNIDSDEPDYQLQFRPNVRYNVGTYVNIPNNMNEYEDWMIVMGSHAVMFPKYRILKCNYTLRWIADDKRIYEQRVVLKTRNSYSSGIWSNNFMVTLDNQIQVWMPFTELTKTIEYNRRFLITYNELHPVSYKVTKVEDAVAKGLVKLTLLQDEVGNEDNLDLMIADYYKYYPKDNVEHPSENRYAIIGDTSIIVNSNGMYRINMYQEGSLVDVDMNGIEILLMDTNETTPSTLATFEHSNGIINISAKDVKGTFVLILKKDSDILARKQIKIKGLL